MNKKKDLLFEEFVEMEMVTGHLDAEICNHSASLRYVLRCVDSYSVNMIRSSMGSSGGPG